MTQRSAIEAPARIRVLSANLWNGRADGERFAELAASLEVDVIAVQELGPAQAAALQRRFPHGVLEPADDFNGMGIVARLPVSVRRIALSYRDARVADLVLRGADGAAVAVELVNVHIEAPHQSPTWRTVSRRRRQWRGLERHLNADPHRPRLMVGDFNSTPLWPFYRRVATHLRDAALIHAARAGGPVRRTWGPWPGSVRLVRIDHAFVHRLDVLDFRVLDVPNGDHNAVLVDVAAKGGDQG